MLLPTLMKATRVMTKSVHCITPEVSLVRAWATMQRLHVRHLPVLWGQHLVGMVSDRDLLKHAQLGPTGEVVFEGPRDEVNDVMTRAPITIGPHGQVSDLAKLMVLHHIDAVPIVTVDGVLIGLVTTTDLLELLMEPDQQSDVLPFSFALRTPEETMSTA